MEIGSQPGPPCKRLFSWTYIFSSVFVTGVYTYPEHTPKNELPTPVSQGVLTRKEFHTLADVLPELEWFANIDNARTRRAYHIDLKDFMRFVGILNPSDRRMVTPGASDRLAQGLGTASAGWGHGPQKTRRPFLPF
jgi:hypothetical protein